MRDNRTTSKSELRRSVLEMIRAARHLIDLKKNDPLRAGIYKITRQRLNRIEKQLWKSQSKDAIDTIANEVAKLIGNLTKSLIRYLLPPYMQWASLHSQ
jgi:hypothetical protein